MAQVAIDSSWLKMVDYEVTTGALRLELKSGKVYDYVGVPLEHFQGLLLAKSAGKYYGEHIKGKYQVPDETQETPYG